MGLLEFGWKYRLYMAGNHDIVQGTWGGGSGNHLGVFFLCLSAIVLARLRRGWQGPKALLFGAFVLLMVLSSSRSAILISPLVFMFVLREKMKNPQYWIVAVTVVVFLAATLAFYYRNTDAEVGRDLGSDQIVFQLRSRTGVIPIMSQALRENSSFPPFGSGPGTYLSPTGGFYDSKIYMQIESMIRTEEVIHPFISASYGVVWVEYGIVGLILFAMVFVRFFFFAWQQEKVIESFFWKDYFRALQAIVIVYAVVGGIFPLWTHFQMSIYLWLFPAIGVRYVVLSRQRAAKAAEPHPSTSMISFLQG